MRVGLLRDSETCFGRMGCVQDERRNRSGREKAVWRQPLIKCMSGVFQASAVTAQTLKNFERT